jgi:hypothetical protein
MKFLICRKYSCQKLTQFSQGNHVIDAAASNLGGFLWINTCVSSTLLNNLFGAYKPISTLKTIISRKHSFQKLTQFSRGNNVLDTPASNMDGFLSRDT